ncbi:MAG TPA: hypothetical protein VMU78_00155 [Methylocella sp.]|nr:hypothetical protein [Methylocella sp.]
MDDTAAEQIVKPAVGVFLLQVQQTALFGFAVHNLGRAVLKDGDGKPAWPRK